ncbi:uncharacterized protein PV07_02823 [Cladophialophora immunda]|uniref:Uncharacterized protein n=1 Tax=Cladophialophora immunda TaxID=569365 RepID=A0A0D2CJ32_9EURO|nr:uncharacterized protein PV07_02823 [Cladophialophora immunda]KIW31153.1 hypothetical protein PV07_02823 [Cladophialophora immunda]OQV00094.1 hypothetical protein CLAIMM_05636 [Cladophialophora immunda]
MAPSSAFRKPKSAFSPPRPGKSKNGKSTKEKGAATKSAARHRLGGMGNSKVHKQPRKPKAGQRPKPRKPVQKGAAGTMRAILGEASSESDPDVDDEDGAGSEEDNENMDAGVDEDESLENDDDDNDDNAQDDEDADEDEASLAHDHDLNLSSPEPDFILAEVTTKGTGTASSASSTNPSIPLPLIHRIMHAHFSQPDQTSLSSDARQLMGKYTEIFVREAIRRCVDDKRERVARGSGDGARDGAVVGDTGWLEVEDLERVGVQLCLDF